MFVKIKKKQKIQDFLIEIQNVIKYYYIITFNFWHSINFLGKNGKLFHTQKNYESFKVLDDLNSANIKRFTTLFLKGLN